jgi:periplasmic mercuric ion binding protein
MKAFVALAAFALAGAFTLVLAAPKTVTLSVPGMNCAACPITVKKALGNVDGVERVQVDLDKRQAIVLFDDAKTTIEALTDATRNAGYPSTPIEERK